MSDSEERHYINRVSYMIPDGTVRTVTYAELIERDALTCPNCGEPIWDRPFGHNLAKCWGCGVAFDTMSDE